MSALAPTSFDLTDRDAVRQLMSNQRHHMRQLDSGMKNLGAIYMIIKDFIGLFFVTKGLQKTKLEILFIKKGFTMIKKIIFHHCSSSYLLKQYEVFLIQFVAYIQQSSAYLVLKYWEFFHKFNRINGNHIFGVKDMICNNIFPNC